VPPVPAEHECVCVPRELYERLSRARRELGIRSWAEFFERVLKLVEKKKASEEDDAIWRLMCFELRALELPVEEWVEILWKRLGDVKRAARALAYLVNAPGRGKYIVDLDKCINYGRDWLP
jgi:hypothetical protein